jgi:excisionase family DNA binding protein
VNMEPGPKLLFTRKEAADALSICVSSVDVMIARGMIRVIRKGRRVMVPKAELERAAKRDDVVMWPAKLNGRTRRTVRRTPQELAS